MTQGQTKAYDEPHTRTRLSWLRTLLIVGGLTFLIERSLLLTDAPLIVMLATGIGAIGWASVGLRRYFQLREYVYNNVSVSTIVLVASLTGLSIPFAIVAIVSV